MKNIKRDFRLLKVVPKKGAESVALGRADGSGTALLLPSMSSDPLLRVTQLEQNIRFLHEQHQLMLSGLHQEIETLRRRNRDLQFQLVFTKKNAVYGGQQTSSESSPDDDGKTKTLAASPNQMCNTQNLQVEMLEKDILDLRTTLNDLSERNNNLSKTLDEQAERLEKALSIEGEYEARLEDANKLIKRLRRENDDQRREMSILRSQLNSKGSIPSTSPSSSAGAGGRHGSGGGSRRGGPGSGGPNGRGERDKDSSRDHNVNQRDNSSQQHHRFPPLHTQQYWQRSRQQSSDCGPGGQNSGNNSENSPMLPHLQLRHHHFNNQHPQNKGNHHNGSGRYYNGNHSGGHHHYYNNNHRGNRSGGGSGGREGSGGSGGGANRGGSGNQKQQQHQDGQ